MITANTNLCILQSHNTFCKLLGSHNALKYKKLLDLFSQRTWRWPNKGRNMSSWQCTIFTVYKIKFWYFPDRASQYIYLNINQLDALNFIMSLFHASTCFEHTCSASGGQNCTIQPLVSSHLHVWWYQRLYSTILASWRWARVLETCRGMK